MLTVERGKVLHSFGLYSTNSTHWKARLIKPAEWVLIRKPQQVTSLDSAILLIQYWQRIQEHLFKAVISHQQIYTMNQEPQSHTTRPECTERTTIQNNTYIAVFVFMVSTRQGSTDTSQKQGAKINDHHFTPVILPVIVCKTTILSLRDVTVGKEIILLTKSIVNMFRQCTDAGIGFQRWFVYDLAGIRVWQVRCREGLKLRCWVRLS